MNIEKTVKILNALGHEFRLKIIKQLVVVGKDGLCPCHLVENLKTTNANLSFHLKELENAGLVSKEKKGKYIHYRANCKMIKKLGDYLIEGCCEYNPHLLHD